MGTLWRIAIPFVAIVLIGVVGILWLTAGEEAEVRRVYAEMLDAGRRYDAERLVDALSVRYNYEEVNYSAMVDRIRAAVQPGRYSNLTEIEGPTITAIGDGATIEAHLRALVSPMPYPVPLLVRVHLRRETQGWKVTGIEVHRYGSE